MPGAEWSLTGFCFCFVLNGSLDDLELGEYLLELVGARGLASPNKGSIRLTVGNIAGPTEDGNGITIGAVGLRQMSAAS